MTRAWGLEICKDYQVKPNIAKRNVVDTYDS